MDAFEGRCWVGGQCENACSQFITNQNLELDANIPNPIPPFPAPQSETSFQNGWVNGWFVSHGSPHHIQFDPNYNGSLGHCILNWQIKNGTEIPCIIPSREGMFTTLNFNSLDDYNLFCLDFDVKTIDCFNTDIEMNFIVSLTNELVTLLPEEDPLIPKPLVLQEEILFDEIIDERGIFHYSTSFIPSQLPTYNQLWIYGQIVENSPGITPIQFQNINLACTTTSLSDIATCNFGTSVSFEAVNESNNHPFTEFEWDFGDGLTSTLATPTHSYSSPGMYNVCLDVKNNIGCCARICKQIQVDEQLIDIRTNYCSYYTFSIENPDPSMNYSWSILAGSPSTGTGTMFSTMVSQNGTYTVSVIGQNACGSVSSTLTFEVLCSLDPPSCLNQVNCVYIGANANSITRLSDLVLGEHPVIPSIQFLWMREIRDLCFSVQGKLIVDVPILNFVNTDWYMYPGAEIEIVENGLFGAKRFANSHLQGCDQMWRGIIVRQNASAIFGNGLSLMNTTIEDAWRAVELETNTIITSDYSTFEDNYIGIFVPESNGQNNIVHTQISNTTFEDRENMLPAYPGQPNYSERFYAGIVSNNVNSMIIGNIISSGRNTFKNLIFGIRSHHSNLSVYNNDFIDTYWDGATTGIFVTPSGPITNIQNDNYFENMDADIIVNGGVNANVFVRGNNEFIRRKPVVGSSRSIHIFGSNSFSVNILENAFFANDWGLRLEGNFRNMHVDNNEFTVESPNARFLNLDNVQTPGNIASISYNDIYFDLTSAYQNTLFSINNCSHLTVLENEVHNNTSITVTVDATAFDVTDFDRCIFKGNVINWPGRGFTLANSGIDANGYCCNDVNDEPSSSSNFNFRYYGNHGMSFFKQNRLNRLNLYEKAIIGEQFNSGNIWEGSGTLASITSGTVEDAGKNRFTTKFSIIGAKPTNISPPSISSFWFKNEDITPPTCTNTPDCDIPVFNFQNDDPDLTDSNPDPQDPPIIIVDPAKPSCEVIKDLYIRLNDVDSIVDPLEYWYLVSVIHKWKVWKGAAWIQSCLDSIVSFNPDITPWYDAEKEKEDVYKATYTQRQNLAPYMEDILNLTDSINHIQLDSTLVMTSTEVQLYEDLQSALTWYDSIVNVFNQTMIDRASDLLTDLIALPTPFSFLVDKKKVWIAEMKIVIGGISALDSIEWDEIRQIAQKCPAEYGQAVYEAQSLMLKLNEFFQSDPECIPSTWRIRKQKDNVEGIHVSPNPGTGLFQFSWQKNVKLDQISIFDINGKVIARNENLAGRYQVIFDLSNQVSGIYFWEVEENNKVKQKGKIIKI